MSPVMLFAIYMHGQLDIIPTVLLLIAVYYLMKNENKRDLLLFSVFLALSIGTKFHILAAVPILFLYLYKKRGLTAAGLCGCITLTTVLVMAAPLLHSEGFWNYVIMNKEQLMMTRVFIDYESTKLIIPMVVIVILYLKVFQLNNMNKNLLLCIMNVLFSVFLVCVPPMPAWFVWIVPYMAIYFILNNENKYKLLSVYFLFQMIYLIYFIFCHQTEFVDLYFLNISLQEWKVDSASIKNVIFTIMAGCLLMIVSEVYRSGVTSNSLYKRMNLPFTIGIAGDSGTGKSELLMKIEHLLGGSKKILYLEGDGDHRWKRGDMNWEKYTHLDPKANYLYRQAEDIRTLRAGSSVRRADYDHDTGTFTRRRRVSPKPYIILCGLHSLYLPQTRKALDLKIYMDTDETLRRLWKIQRDTGKRGYSSEEIIRQIEKRIPDAMQYIYPQKEFADLQITYFDSTLKDCFDAGHEVVLSLKLSISISIDIEEILMNLEQYAIIIRQNHCKDLKHQEIIFDGRDFTKQKIDYQQIAHDTIPQFDELFVDRIVWEDGIEGILQLFILAIISVKMRGEG